MPIPGLRSDPLPAFNFYISLIDSSSVMGQVLSAISFVAAGGFTECSGLETSLEVETYNQGGVNNYVLQFPTRVTYSNIVLKRGVGFSEDLWNWHFSYVSNKGARRDGLIFLRNELHIPIKIWVFKRGLPVKWTGPSFNASQSSVAIEGVEIAHEGLELISPGAVAAQVGIAIAAAF
jgi:phage tail-like protein